MTCQIKIFRDSVSELTIDRQTGIQSGADPVLLWEGKARIQPRRASERNNTGLSSTQKQRVQFQTPTFAEVLRVNDRVEVTQGYVNDALDDYTYIVTDIINTGNQWVNTFDAMADTRIS